VPGVDGAGVVVAKGARVRRIQLGDRVYAYEFGNRQGGFYAEFAAAKAEHVGRVPKGLDLREAGAVATTGLTALQGIDALELRPGQTVLIFGASGAVGTMAVQFARQRGAYVIATASGAAPARLVRQLGAHYLIDARRAASIEQLRQFAPDGLDGVFALAGGRELEQCLDFMRPKGRVVHPNGIEPVPMERPTFRGRAFDAVANPREFDRLNRHIGNGRIRVPIAASYPLGKAAQAHRRLDREHALGRMVLRVRRDRQWSERTAIAKAEELRMKRQKRPQRRWVRRVKTDSTHPPPRLEDVWTMTLATMGDDIAAMLDYLKIQEADLVGHSFGGASAIRAAIQHPDHVRRLVVISSRQATRLLKEPIIPLRRQNQSTP
jgi:NADPH:quinone reductase